MHDFDESDEGQQDVGGHECNRRIAKIRIAIRAVRDLHVALLLQLLADAQLGVGLRKLAAPQHVLLVAH